MYGNNKKKSIISQTKIKIKFISTFIKTKEYLIFDISTAESSSNMGSSSNFENNQTSGQNGEKATFAKLEEYVELLYEELPEKVRGAALIMQLSKEQDNLDELSRSGKFDYIN